MEINFLYRTVRNCYNSTLFVHVIEFLSHLINSTELRKGNTIIIVLSIRAKSPLQFLIW
jgi:hypothetical protein